MDEIINRWRGWRLKNTFLLAVSLIVFFWLAGTPAVKAFISGIGELGYLGALVVGMLFVSTYTAAPAGVVLFDLADTLDPVGIALVAGVGSMLGDYLILRYLRDRVFDEIKPLLAKVRTPTVRRLFRTPYFAWLLPLSGALIIASPLPDEMGVSLIGASKMKNTHFLLFSYVLNALGILAIVIIARAT